MASDAAYVIPLADAAACPRRLVGGKARILAQLHEAGMRVQPGFCVTTRAYDTFVAEAGLTDVIRMEIGRKSFRTMRWEELWDAALRVRSAFLAAPVPTAVLTRVEAALDALPPNLSVAVRSSAPAEDEAGSSFAGLHESVTDVRGLDEVTRAIRLVWASLWSDAALLYRRELGLDPLRSRMAVLVQSMAHFGRSGVAFGRDPRDVARDAEMIEAVAGPCADLVDGRTDPDRWLLERSSGRVLEWRRGERRDPAAAAPLLDDHDLVTVHEALQACETLLGFPPDVEWTGRLEELTLLQARPITGPRRDDDERAGYLRLRLTPARLAALRDRVVGEVIPALLAAGERLAAEAIDDLDDTALARALDARADLLDHWRGVYRTDLIPFAHGVRRLGAYYNDAVQPADPFEFVGLLRGLPLISFQRNEALRELAATVRDDAALSGALRSALAAHPPGRADPGGALRVLRARPDGAAFAQRFAEVLGRFMDTVWNDVRLVDRPDLVLATVAELADAGARPVGSGPDMASLERGLMDAVGPDRHDEAREVLATARVSWRLRDDDNLLMGRIESHLLHAAEEAARRLRAAGRLAGPGPRLDDARELARALRDPAVQVDTSRPEPARPSAKLQGDADGGAQPLRQIVGQPAAPGLVSGPARRVDDAESLGRVRPGDVLVCAAIQPAMSHILPLVGGVVEGRGGMLIHGAIIARELGVPCVNGIAGDWARIPDGELVTVDGHLGIVTLGPPDFAPEAEEAT